MRILIEKLKTIIKEQNGTSKLEQNIDTWFK